MYKDFFKRWTFQASVICLQAYFWVNACPSLVNAGPGRLLSTQLLLSPTQVSFRSAQVSFRSTQVLLSSTAFLICRHSFSKHSRGLSSDKKPSHSCNVASHLVNSLPILMNRPSHFQQAFLLPKRLYWSGISEVAWHSLALSLPPDISSVSALLTRLLFSFFLKTCRNVSI